MLKSLVPAILGCVFSASVAAADLRIIAPNAVKEVITAAAERYERASGNRTVLTWSGSEAITKRIGEGEVFDVVLNTPQNLDTLAKAGKVTLNTRTDFAKSGIGIAVRAGQPRLDVSNDEAVRKALLDAKSIGISSGPSGRYMAGLFQRLGLADKLQTRIKQPSSGTQIADLLLSGEVELAFQQISELQHVRGVDYLGPLPAGLQSYTIWSGGLHSATNDAVAGRNFLNTLRTSDSATVIRNSGMEPM